MPYATPAQFLARYQPREAVQLLLDEGRLLTVQLLLDAIAGTWTGSPTSDQQAAATAALAELTRSLHIAGNYMDGYLRSAITLPIDSTDPNGSTLEECCVALTRELLADDPDKLTDQITANANRWRKWLSDVAANRVQLVAADGSNPPSSGRTLVGTAASGYPWTSFGGVR